MMVMEISYMTESVKLSENDFDYIPWEKDIIGAKLFEIVIYGESELYYNKVKQQILDNQEKAEKLEILHLKIKSEIQNGKITVNLLKLEEIFNELPRRIRNEIL